MENMTDEMALRAGLAVVALHALIPKIGPSQEQHVETAVRYADLLIERLKKAPMPTYSRY